MARYNKKATYKEWKFNNTEECDFFIRFVENSGKRFEVCKEFELFPKFPTGGYEMKRITYTPTVIVYDTDGHIEHVYDVRGGFNQQAVDMASRIRFELFAWQEKAPVEVVIPGENDFKTKLYDFISPRIQSPHARYDRHGNMKCKSNGEPLYDFYDVHKTINYDISDTIGR